MFTLMLLLWTWTADAALVSRLGSLYFYDPLTFDSGALQHGGVVRGGAGAGGGLLEIAAEAPFYRELSARVAHQQNLRGFETPNGHRLSWRLRAPIIQSTRFGRLDTVQFHYVGGINLAAVSAMAPTQEAGGALLTARSVSGPAISNHLQLAAIVRSPEQAGLLSRTGLVAREALIVQLGRPRPGPRGRWTTSASVAEVDWKHYGLVRRMQGQLDVSVLSPTVHLTHGRATWSLGAYPRMRINYDPDEVGIGWGGFATLRVSHAPRME